VTEAWPQPLAAALSMSGMASTNALSITQPASIEIKTARTMPRGAARDASTVSSDVCAEASKPVMV